ncbi:hypothetical protein [Actinoplanes derwentensis]|uniref:Uncharacterized protein n=1 Tax=Actinoplanes derwentensis TaxID=113562 RepID=A0A1H1XLU6_9ACTN|nr:hypothetical protein [Actinoplanes derwentensis]GID87737.1 hypothetical protein Ade03nite_66610 [Actinoplanes derwentensis]SDT10295.1 hypothetical protein SAMN04489716_2513 [Actinoplanes derwentensis]
MSQPHGTLRVDPDGVASVGDTYARQAVVYQEYQNRLRELRDRYVSAWGTDELGAKYTEKFEDGVETVNGIVGGTRQRLNYAAAALQAAGKAYNDADDSARDLTHRVALGLDQPGGSAGGGSLSRPLTGERLDPASGAAPVPFADGAARADVPGFVPGGALTGSDPEPHSAGAASASVPGIPRGGAATGAMAGTPLGGAATGAVAGAPLGGAATAAVAGAQLGGAATGAVAGAPLGGAVTAGLAGEPLAPAVRLAVPETPGSPLGGVPLAPAAGASAAAVDTPPLAPWGAPLETGAALAAPVRMEPRLEALPPGPDGGSVVDAARYNSVAPAVGPDGQMADDRGWRYFMVEDNPSVDPTAAGYRPLHVTYSPPNE